MRTRNAAYLDDFAALRSQVPDTAHFELTRRCNFDCVHCYCRKLRGGLELSIRNVKKVLDRLREAGCLWLCLTGGECLLRRDFPGIYLYAKKQGFLVSVFSNGYAFTPELFALFAKSPPYRIEITLNGITPPVFDAVTNTRGRLPVVLRNIETLAGLGLRITVKANCLKLNAGEIPAIKRWVDGLFGKPKKPHYRFRVDPVVLAGMEADSGPCAQRLSFAEIEKLYLAEPDLRREHIEDLSRPCAGPARAGRFLYHCNSWRRQFFIAPDGIARFCVISGKYGGNLLALPAARVFADFARISRAVFKTSSQCSRCPRRGICSWCPAKALQEAGNEEYPIRYFCEFAQSRGRAANRKP